MSFVLSDKQSNLESCSGRSKADVESTRQESIA